MNKNSEKENFLEGTEACSQPCHLPQRASTAAIRMAGGSSSAEQVPKCGNLLEEFGSAASTAAVKVPSATSSLTPGKITVSFGGITFDSNFDSGSNVIILLLVLLVRSSL